ncbi:MAG: SoxR reducing system RseC family protein [Magnetococcales bacterium]|nr:SoxR reducing system RseC family protein [Magnetococcales bacterium]
MLREEGRVTALDGEFAEVATTRKNACGGCSAQGSCSALSGNLGQRETRVRARNLAGARVGERVVLELSAAQFHKMSFIVYMAPVIAFFICGAGVRWLWLTAWPQAIQGAELAGALAGLVSLAFSFLFMRGYNRRLEQRGGVMPVIAEAISGDAFSSSCGVGCGH